MNKRAIGNKKEENAKDYLEAEGFKIIERNFYNRHGEIDIIAIKNNYICFIEVKYRKNSLSGHPEEAVTRSKMKKICKAALYYIYTHKQFEKYQMRFDVVAIEGSNISLYENAFEYVN